MEIRKPLSATCYEREPVTVEATWQARGRGERVRRAAALAGPLLLVAILIVPIPGVHLSVPVLLGLAGWLGWKRLRERETLLRIEGPCPACAAPQSWPPPADGALPANVRCPGCGEFAKLAAPAAADQGGHAETPAETSPGPLTDPRGPG